MPQLAKRADKYTVIRSVTTLNKPGDHSQAPLYWLTGNPRLTTGSDEYPMYGSAVSKLRPGTKVLYTSGYTDNAIVHQGRLDPGVLLLTKPYRKSQLANMVRRR